MNKTKYEKCKTTMQHHKKKIMKRIQKIIFYLHEILQAFYTVWYWGKTMEMKIWSLTVYELKPVDWPKVIAPNDLRKWLFLLVHFDKAISIHLKLAESLSLLPEILPNEQKVLVRAVT